MNLTDIRAQLAVYQETKRKIAALEERLQAAESMLKAYLGEQEEVTVDGVKIRWTPYTAKRLDTTRLKEEQPEIYGAYLKETQGRRFLVTY